MSHIYKESVLFIFRNDSKLTILTKTTSNCKFELKRKPMKNDEILPINRYYEPQIRILKDDVQTRVFLRARNSTGHMDRYKYQIE